MDRDELCSNGKVFVEDEKYALSRYEVAEQNLCLMAHFAKITAPIMKSKQQILSNERSE